MSHRRMVPKAFVSHSKAMNRTLPADEWPEHYTTKLTAILRTIHNRDVIVLTDRYDTHASEHGYFQKVCTSQV